jgi:post-segregation antitoxin (ccd killing protein)
MARPKSDIKRKSINTNIDVELIKLLKDINIDTGIPMNRLIEDAIRETYKDKLLERGK